MSYCTVAEVYDATGLDESFLIELSNRLTNADEVNTLIGAYISDATVEIQDLLQHPLVVSQEKHIMNDDISGLTMTRVYLGNYDETYALPNRHLKTFNVQDKVTAVLRVWVGGAVILKDDDNYAWSHTANNGYIDFTDDLSDGTIVNVTYEYDPYENSNVPRNIKKACALLAGIDLLDFCIGIRQQDVEFDAQSESGVPNPSRDPLVATRSKLKRKYDESMASEGYGWEFTPIKGS